MKVCSDCQQCYDDQALNCTEEGHRALSELHDGSPEMIAGYRLEFLIETGLNGDVYLARREDCGQACQIRILSTDAEHTEHFLREAKLAAAMFHPSVVDVYEVGSLAGNRPYIVAEDGGKTLRQLLTSVGVPQLLTAIRIVRQTAEALHELHLKGLTHRAIRPENIVLTTDAEHQLVVRIQNIDLGGVREHSIVSNKFLIDSAIDSLRYFAPEQFSGEGTSTQTDVYSLGIVFYEMLAGAPPFDADKAAGVIEKHRNERPHDIKIDDFELRMLVTHSLMEALQKRPDKRQPSANTFARQLRHIEQLATHVSTPPPAVVAPPPVHQPAIKMQVADARPEPVTVRQVEPKPIPAVIPERVAEAPVILIEHPAVESHAIEAAPSLHRSRLKLYRKRPHAKVDQAPAALAPKKIELEQSADDIPSVAEVIEILASEPVAEPPIVYAEPKVTESAPVRNSVPKKVEWIQPEDDIPSVEDVVEVRAKEQTVETPVIKPKPTPRPKAIADVPVRGKPVKAELPPVEHVYPSPAAVAKFLAKMKTAVVEPEPEEITLVRAPSKRITIEWEKKGSAVESIRDEISFFPTILGDVEEKTTTDLTANDSFLSEYYNESQMSSSVPYRAIAIGVGFMALMAVIFFGSNSVERYVRARSAESTGEPVAAKTTSAEERPLPSTPASVALPAVTKILKTVEKSVNDSDVDVREAERPKPVVTKEQVPAEKTEKISVAPAHVKTTPLVPSTLVISSNNGKVNIKTEPTKTNGATRPRVVKNPKP
ncbi:MAG TPA: protein kinase [Pyrinomonadaceae bacterium]|nr:protein kinase [Pyrinomonadaceae bacterium]